MKVSLLLLCVGLVVTPLAAQGPLASDLLGLAESAYLQGDLATAASLYRAAAGAEPEPEQAARHLVTAGWLEFQRGELAAAGLLLDEALVRQPELPFSPELYTQGFVDLLAERRGLLVAERSARARDKVREGIAALSGRRFDAARAALREALEIAPDDPSALFNLALVDLESDHSSAAIAGFERILSLAAAKPGLVTLELRARSQASLANAYFRAGYFEDCENAARAAITLDPRNAQAWELLGLVQKRQERYDDATASFRKALELLPDDPRIANNLAAVAIARQQWIEAVALLSEASRKHTGDASLWLNLGLAQRGMANIDGAAISLERAVATAGDDAGLRARAAAALAFVELDRGRAREAEGAAREAVRLDGASVDARLALGSALLRLGRPVDAVGSYEAARALDPTRAEVFSQLGVALVAAGRRDDAADAFRRVLSLRPGDPDARANLDAVLGGRPLSIQTPTRPVAPPPPAKRESGLTFESIDYLKGALVKEVVPGSVGGRAGLERGDLIVAADGKPIDRPSDLERVISVAIPGLPIAIDLVRDGVRRGTSLVF